MEDMSSFSKVGLCKLVLVFTPHLPKRRSPFSLPDTELGGRGVQAPFSKRNVWFAFRHLREGQRALLASTDSQLPSAQNSPYAKVMYSGVACSFPPPNFGDIINI